jgi:uncharacterized protein (UPF0210 family)
MDTIKMLKDERLRYLTMKTNIQEQIKKYQSDKINKRYDKIKSILNDKINLINFQISVLSIPNTASEFGDDYEQEMNLLSKL